VVADAVVVPLAVIVELTGAAEAVAATVVVVVDASFAVLVVAGVVVKVVVVVVVVVVDVDVVVAVVAVVVTSQTRSEVFVGAIASYSVFWSQMRKLTHTLSAVADNATCSNWLPEHVVGTVSKGQRTMVALVLPRMVTMGACLSMTLTVRALLFAALPEESVTS